MSRHRTSLTQDNRRGLALSINSLSMRLGSAAGPTVGGYLLQEGVGFVPFVAAAVLHLGSTILYGRFFREFDASGTNSPPSQTF
ncbi:MAG: hypothetical protein C7B45_11405 [Sulfobacillus acidophilus]|uniref:Uncharacterized protein n=1 Tax=Sulfobacillus acidophilus TaxID=53633 RepID=A0A2T2WGE5_9FIRM|nr:MAG: hypothetical protein C7B45_11405 [Sulfobacillus acidophilus]